MGRILAKEEGQQNSITQIRDVVLKGLTTHPRSLMLHYTLGLCQRSLDQTQDAEKTFALITDTDLDLDPHDPAPVKFGRNNSAIGLAMRASAPGVVNSLNPSYHRKSLSKAMLGPIARI